MLYAMTFVLADMGPVPNWLLWLVLVLAAIYLAVWLIRTLIHR